MANNETIADIAAEKRREADDIEASTYKPYDIQRERIAELRREADRLDRARKRMEIEIANLIRKENAKLREAIAKIRFEAYECDQGGEYLGEGADPGFDRIIKMCEAALATTSIQNTHEE